MVTAIFEEMKLAGEVGSLLKIEQEITALVAVAKKQWEKEPKAKQLELFGRASVVKEHQLEFDLTGITDERFFEKAEEEIYQALGRYASATSNGVFRRKLFAKDAANGFAFIELCKLQYDCALMNPPFGSGLKATAKYLDKKYLGAGASEIAASFFSRVLDLLTEKGRIGEISSRTFFLLPTVAEWRISCLYKQSNLIEFVDLGTKCS